MDPVALRNSQGTTTKKVQISGQGIKGVDGICEGRRNLGNMGSCSSRDKRGEVAYRLMREGREADEKNQYMKAQQKKTKGKVCLNDNGLKRHISVPVPCCLSLKGYLHAPWLRDRRPWTQSRSSSWLPPGPPVIKAETSALNSAGAFP